MAELTINIFDSDPFSAVSMTGKVNEGAPYTPGVLTAMTGANGQPLFAGSGVYTTVVALDDVNGALSLIQTSPRGAPPTQSTTPKGKIRRVECAHLKREAPITADEMLGVRVHGTASQLQTAERLIYAKVEKPGSGLKAQLAGTLEHMYLGAVDGVVYDADNATVLWDYFDLYGVARPSTQQINFGTYTADGGGFKTLCNGLRRTTLAKLNGLETTTAGMVALCGDDFFDAVDGNKEVVKSRQLPAVGNANGQNMVSVNTAFSSIVYGGVTWINYRGSEDAAGVKDAKISVPADEARLFWNGVPGLFETYFAPADTWEFVGSEGLPLYMLQRPERQTSSARVFEVQSNPVPICLRPLSLLRLKKA